MKSGHLEVFWGLQKESGEIRGIFSLPRISPFPGYFFGGRIFPALEIDHHKDWKFKIANIYEDIFEIVMR